MGAGDIVNTGAIDIADGAAIIAALSGAVVVADDITAYVSDKQVYFTIVKAA